MSDQSNIRAPQLQVSLHFTSTALSSFEPQQQQLRLGVGPFSFDIEIAVLVHRQFCDSRWLAEDRMTLVGVPADLTTGRVRHVSLTTLNCFIVTFG
jgi:hypothetical protein